MLINITVVGLKNLDKKLRKDDKYFDVKGRI